MLGQGPREKVGWPHSISKERGRNYRDCASQWQTQRAQLTWSCPVASWTTAQNGAASGQAPISYFFPTSCSGFFLLCRPESCRGLWGINHLQAEGRNQLLTFPARGSPAPSCVMSLPLPFSHPSSSNLLFRVCGHSFYLGRAHQSTYAHCWPISLTRALW